MIRGLEELNSALPSQGDGRGWQITSRVSVSSPIPTYREEMQSNHQTAGAGRSSKSESHHV